MPSWFHLNWILSALKKVFCDEGGLALPDGEKEESENILTDAGAPFFSATKTATQGFLPGDKEYEAKGR